ncbi:MAG: pyocin knob domain-containing protein [Acutalibacteraceae bacterium]
MRTIKIDFSSGTPRIECDSSAAGIQGEHRASELVIIPPPDMPSGLSYRLAFDPGGQSDTLSLTDGELHYELPQSITQHDAVSMTVEGYEGEERIYKSVMVELYFDAAVDTDNPVDADGHSIGAEVAANTAARHSHSNKETLDKFGETDGNPTYNGQPIGGGCEVLVGTPEVPISLHDPRFVANDNKDYVIRGCISDYPMGDAFAEFFAPKENTGATYRITKCFVDSEQCIVTLDVSAFAALIESDAETIGLISPRYHALYYDGTWEEWIAGRDCVVTPLVGVDEENPIDLNTITESGVYTLSGYMSNLPSDSAFKLCSYALLIVNKIMSGYSFQTLVFMGTVNVRAYTTGTWSNWETRTHSHDNKPVLDMLSAADGKLQYAGSDVGLKGDTGATGPQGEPGADGYTPVKGTDYWTEEDKAEIVDDVLAALPTWTGGSY